MPEPPAAPEPGAPEPGAPEPAVPEPEGSSAALAAGSARELLLPRSPGMLAQYLRAVLPRPGARAEGIPERVLRLVGVRPDGAQVTRYCDVVGQPAGDHLPLLFPHLLGFPLQLRLMTDPDFPFPALGLVHISNEVVAARPLPLADPLDLEVYAGAVRAHPRGRAVDLITVVRRDGVAVWSETSTYLHREGQPAGGSAAAPERPDPAPVAGELHHSARWRLGADLGRRYAAVSGDRNPIHLYPLTARVFGFRRAIAHGMWTAAAVVGALQGRLPESLTYTVQFRRPLLLPSTVRLFTAVTPTAARAEVRARDEDATVHLSATVRAL